MSCYLCIIFDRHSILQGRHSHICSFSRSNWQTAFLCDIFTTQICLIVCFSFLFYQRTSLRVPLAKRIEHLIQKLVSNLTEYRPVNIFFGYSLRFYNYIVVNNAILNGQGKGDNRQLRENTLLQEVANEPEATKLCDSSFQSTMSACPFHLTLPRQGPPGMLTNQP